MSEVNIQDLLNVEAQLSNAGDNVGADVVRVIIRRHRESTPPFCFGDDDCSSTLLVQCPWRFDCSNSSISWENPVDRRDELLTPPDYPGSIWAIDKTKTKNGEMYVFIWKPHLMCWSSESTPVKF